MNVCVQVEMVKEGLEGALMEGIGTETVVWQWHVYCVCVLDYLKFSFHKKYIHFYM